MSWLPAMTYNGLLSLLNSFCKMLDPTLIHIYWVTYINSLNWLRNVFYMHVIYIMHVLYMHDSYSFYILRLLVFIEYMTKFSFEWRYYNVATVSEFTKILVQRIAAACSHCFFTDIKRNLLIFRKFVISLWQRLLLSLSY